ncbi:hypothetical protein TSOC_011075 [Tetrabaena socialis]|uniref:phytol kinase n=1 Tax=Tetrabaena socialis TaxID=47790 RepID=A0A2J7ZRJ9_9CHLO|nr:hypothetical protein TSOC_011075 [Tetrabaena socialis]|eukprot:PNH02899.1 hypothetical protein TSOC_011075 [Tetrabaena socialis]
MRSREPPGGGASSKASAALDRVVRSALRRLPTLVDRLLVDDRPRQPKEDDVEELVGKLASLRASLKQLGLRSAKGAAAAAATVLGDVAIHNALPCLLAAVLRWPLPTPSTGGTGSAAGSESGGSGTGGTGGSCAGGSGAGGSGSGKAVSTGDSGGSDEHRVSDGIRAYARVAWGACCVVDVLMQLLFEQPHVHPAASDFVLKLLRMHTLQCLARLFSAAADSVGALTVLQARYAEGLFYALGSLIRAFQPASAKQLPLASMRRELAEVLHDSHVLEHAARLLLRLMLQGAATGAAPIGRDDTTQMSRVFLASYRIIGSQYDSVEQEGQDAAASAVLRGVLSGRCTRHVVLAHGVTALCMADGGPAYGLPEDVQQAISAHLKTASPTPGQLAVLQLNSSLPMALIGASAFATLSSPVGMRAGVLLLLRLARLVVSSGDLWEAHAQHQQAGLPLPAHAGGARVVVGRKDVAGLALLSLACAFGLLRERLGADSPAWAVEAGVERWRLTAAALGRNALHGASPEVLRSWGVLLLHKWVPLLPAGEALPLAPPPDLAAALDGGVLPCLERLLRRAGEEPDGPESAVVGALLREGHTWQLWAHLLEYGEPRQAAALVATLGKLLRRANRKALRFEGGCLVGRLCARVLGEALASPRELWATEGRQLARLLVRAACDWLPALSVCALQAMADQPAPGTAGSEFLGLLLGPLFCWPLLLACRWGRADRAVAPAGPTDAAGSSAADNTGDCRLLLLEEVRVVALLGAALRLAPLPRSPFNQSLRKYLAESCCAVAAAFPGEVLRAPSSSAWPPELLRALLPELWEQGLGAVAACTEALAAWLEGGCPGGSGSGGNSSSGDGSGEMARERLLPVVAKVLVGTSWVQALAAPLVPLAEARALLRTCSYRGCTSLAGDSEADARMRWCRFCSVPCYCCGECQLLHWREGGHKEACLGGAKAGPG